MRLLLAILVVAIASTISADNDEISWTEKDAGQKTSRESEARYLVYEPSGHLENFDNNGIHVGLGPQNPGGGPYGPYGRPYAPGYQGNNGVLVGPGGPTGIIGRPPRYDPYGPGGYPDAVPPWIRNDPRHRELDTCKCRYSFNCPSPGLKFGHCAREKKYCCFNSRRFPELLGGIAPHYPYYPGAPHRYPNAFGPNYYGNRRPYGQRPPFDDYHSGGPYGGYGHRNEFEPYGYDAEADDYAIYGRSLGKNRTTPLSERSSEDEEIEKQKKK